MLATSSVTRMLPVIDMKHARKFYEHRSGLQPGGLRPDGKFVYSVGGSVLALFPKPEATKADHTAISFEVSGIDASIADLKPTLNAPHGQAFINLLGARSVSGSAATRSRP